MNKHDPITCSLLSSLPQWRASVNMQCGNHEMTRISVNLQFDRLSTKDARRVSSANTDRTRIPAHILGQPFSLVPSACVSDFVSGGTRLTLDCFAIVDPAAGPFHNNHEERDDDIRELTEALAQLMGKCDFTSGCCRPVAMVGTAIDEYSLERANAILRKVGRR